jgi:glucokinase
VRIISIDLGGTNFKAGVVNRSGEILCRAVVPTPKEKEYPKVLDAIRFLIRDLEQRRPSLRGISIAVPGVVDQSTGEVINCFNIFGTESSSVSLRKDLEKLTGREVKIDRDLNLAALGEHWIGAGKGYRNLICIFIGTGIGSGIIIDNEVFRGAFGAAGEFGHLTVKRDGPLCGCGNRGCVEKLASGPEIAEALKARMGEEAASADAGEITTQKVFDLARSGDRLALQVIEECCSYLGMAIADVVTLLNPELIILGGGVGRQFDFIVDKIWAEIRSRCRPVVWKPLKIAASELWDDAAIIGGARYFFNHRRVKKWQG